MPRAQLPGRWVYSGAVSAYVPWGNYSFLRASHPLEASREFTPLPFALSVAVRSPARQDG